MNERQRRRAPRSASKQTGAAEQPQLPGPGIHGRALPEPIAYTASPRPLREGTTAKVDADSDHLVLSPLHYDFIEAKYQSLVRTIYQHIYSCYVYTSIAHRCLGTIGQTPGVSRARLVTTISRSPR